MMRLRNEQEIDEYLVFMEQLEEEIGELLQDRDYAREYHVPQWVMERAEQYHEGIGDQFKRFKDYRWALE